MDSKQLIPMASPMDFHTPTHVLYADDIMVFFKGTRKNLVILMKLFSLYGDLQGST